MSELQEHRALKILASYFVLLLILISAALFMQSRVTNHLNGTLEKTVARQAADVSLLAEERFARELASLQTAASVLSSAQSEIEIRRVLNALHGTESGVIVGLLGPDGKPVYGAPLTEKEFPRLSQAKGSGVTDYHEGKGLLFAVPAQEGRVLYRLYDESVLIEQFGLPEVSTGSRMLIQDPGGKVVIPYKGYRTSDRLFLSHPVIQNRIAHIREKLQTEPAAAVYCSTEHGEFFICGARLPETNFAAVGYVPWAAVGSDIADLYTLIMRTGSFLFLLLAAAGAYLLFHKGRDSGSVSEEYDDPFPKGLPFRAAPQEKKTSGLLDVALGLNYSKGMESLYWEMLDVFHDLSGETIDRLNEAFQKEDWTAYTALVHSLRSSALSVGGRTLSDAARALEDAGRILSDEAAEESEQKAALAEIRTDHDALISLYEKTSAAAKKAAADHRRESPGITEQETI
ncbi:MAG: Hpt domain-containing protein [Schwartzia sp.]|nr:Hpt domain-containing protein [Schwartzia sp. (in: firmicutes)]